MFCMGLCMFDLGGGMLCIVRVRLPPAMVLNYVDIGSSDYSEFRYKRIEFRSSKYG